ncbi:MAG: hypothetical protein HY794_17555 [Desulfarculus sp.]|nr:hypothetical protein [Desulfarculus sp.]
MEQRIFEMGLSVPATSLYLLLVALSDGGTTLNRANALNFWNLAPKDLDQAFAELVVRRVVGADPDASWFLRPAAEWQ